MKKQFLLLVALCAALLWGCNQPQPNNNTSNEADSPSGEWVQIDLTHNRVYTKRDSMGQSIITAFNISTDTTTVLQYVLHDTACVRMKPHTNILEFKGTLWDNNGGEPDGYGYIIGQQKGRTVYYADSIGCSPSVIFDRHIVSVVVMGNCSANVQTVGITYWDDEGLVAP